MDNMHISVQHERKKRRRRQRKKERKKVGKKEKALEELANYFNEITNEFYQLTIQDLPFTYDRQVSTLHPAEIEKVLRGIKKPKSMVPGDIPPKIISEIAGYVSVPLAYIFNELPTSSWPNKWKKEYQTVIPKKVSPSGPNECRNLSCTNLFSKVFETFVLQALGTEVDTSDIQYGGIKGTGVNHFLVKMWEEIMGGLEEERSSINIMAVDFSMAFNRLQHQACLKALARRGASNQTIHMIYAFLSK